MPDESVSRVIRRTQNALSHGSSDERREAARAVAQLATTSRAACEALAVEALVISFVRVLRDEDDEDVVNFTLFALERIATHFPSAVCEQGLPVQLVSRLDSASASTRGQAVLCVAALCEDEHGVASRRLLDEQLASALARLAAAERESGQIAIVLAAVGVLERLARESQFARALVDGGVHGVLLACSCPLHPDAPEDAHAIQDRALTTIASLATTSDFKALLAAEPTFFPLLFALRDSSVPSLSSHAHAIAHHWADDFFGWAWECCTTCKRVAEKLSLEPAAKPVDDPAAAAVAASAAATAAVNSTPSAKAARAAKAAKASRDAIAADNAQGGADRYREELEAMGEQLREFLAQADDVARGLMRTQTELDDAASACDAFVGKLRHRNLIAAEASDVPAASPDDELPPAEAFAMKCRTLGHSIDQSAERARTSSRQLLLHCNLLLDCDAAVHKSVGHLSELHGLVTSSKAVEVSHRWRQDAHVALRRALIGLSLRLELYARALLAQKEGSGSLLQKANEVLQRMPALRADAAALEVEMGIEIDGVPGSGPRPPPSPKAAGGASR
jgi:hypothetical protein